MEKENNHIDKHILVLQFFGILFVVAAHSSVGGC